MAGSGTVAILNIFESLFVAHPKRCETHFRTGVRTIVLSSTSRPSYSCNNPVRETGFILSTLEESMSHSHLLLQSYYMRVLLLLHGSWTGLSPYKPTRMHRKPMRVRAE